MEQTQKKILIVEDEAAYRGILNEKLSQEGFVVESAVNGEEGLAQALAKHPDLILLDLQMPVLNGIEMAKKLREDEWGRQAKIIVLTNMTDTASLDQAFANEIFQYIVKTDINLEDLVSKIKDVVGQ